MRRGILLAVSSVVFIAIATAQSPFDRQMKLQTCRIDVVADQFTATTLVEMEFLNPHQSDIEGLYTFELAPGQAVTGFELELNGKFREGSIEEKWKATNAYNTIVGKRIDPALLRMEALNQYTLRIFPVPARSTRRVRLRIQQLLKIQSNALRYFLPLGVKDTVNKFALNIQVKGIQSSPHGDAGLLQAISFVSDHDMHRLEINRHQLTLREPVSFSIPLSAEPVVCFRETKGGVRFALRFNPSFEKSRVIRPKDVTILWDMSFGGRRRDRDREIEFLNRYFKANEVETITIIPFNHKAQDTIVYNLMGKFRDVWMMYLRGLSYEGATQFGCLDLTGTMTDQVFLVTDGFNTFGSKQIRQGKALLYTVHCSSSSDSGFLHSLLEEGGGSAIDLTKINLTEAISMAGRVENRIQKVSSASGEIRIDQDLPMPIQHWQLITGSTVRISDRLYLHYGSKGGEKTIEAVSINQHTDCTETIDRIPALASFDSWISKTEWNDVLNWGIEERIVTPFTAYIVLERVEDYIKYNITPPKELEEECERMNFVKVDTRSIRQRKLTPDPVAEMMNVITFYNTRLTEWNTSAPPIVFGQSVAAFNGSYRYAPGLSSYTTTLQGSSLGLSTRSFELSEVVVTGYGTALKKQMTGSVTTIHADQLVGLQSIDQMLEGRVAGLLVSRNSGLPGSVSNVVLRGSSSSGSSHPLYVLDGIPINGGDLAFLNPVDIASITILKDNQASSLYGSRAAGGAIVINSKRGWAHVGGRRSYRLQDMEDVEYLAEIMQAAHGEKRRIYQQLRHEYAEEPGFYFDMAQHFFESGMKVTAHEILMNAAEVSNGSALALRAIGFTLENWGLFEQAAEVYESLSTDSPGNLYYRRDYAWALYRSGKVQQAIEVMMKALEGSFTHDSKENGSVKAMLLHEMNAIIHIHRGSVDISGISAEFIRPMPVDLRIVVDCNKGDYGALSVRQPGGPARSEEGATIKNGKVSYAGSQIGEYQIRDAIKGKYKVSLNYYNYKNYPDKIPTMVRLVIFRNFGKPDQKIEIENHIMDNQYGEIEISRLTWPQ